MRPKLSTLLELFFLSFKLGLTSFGGPTAHLSYFHQEYVKNRKWMSEAAYADLVALCQTLPGPASSQVGMGIGMMRAGSIGGIVSFLGFTLPSVVLLVLFAQSYDNVADWGGGWLSGLKIVAVVIVLQAVLGMGSKLANRKGTATIAFASAIMTLLWPTNMAQVVVITLAGFVGYWIFSNTAKSDEAKLMISIQKRPAFIALALFFGLLLFLPFVANLTQSSLVDLFARFYRSGALVFGGGHVVLPLLEREFVTTGLISKEVFLSGYGATQAVPGPLFTFAAYIGTITNGLFGAFVATVAIFLPAFLLVLGVLPFWDTIRKTAVMNRSLQGVNAAVVGILGAALYDPIFTSSVHTTTDFVFGLFLYLLLEFWKLPSWALVIIGILGGWLFLS